MDLIISAIIGATIGYFTNWLAIKMLFRPFEEKRILGIKIPFTPGLIPKEKERIAQNVGITIEDYLLSPEVIIRSMEKDEDRLKDLIIKKLESLRANNYKLKDIFMNLKEEEKNKQKEGLKEKIALELKDFLKKLKLGQLIIDFLQVHLKDEDEIVKLSDKLVAEYKGIVQSKELREAVRSRIKTALDGAGSDDRYLRDLLSEDLVKGIEKYIDENHKLLLFKIKKETQKENVQAKIKSIIRNLVQSNVSGLIASFLPMDMVEEKGCLALENYLSSDEGGRDLQNILNLSLNNLLNTRMKDLMKELGDTLDEEAITKHIILLLESDRLIKPMKDILVGQMENLDLQFLHEAIDLEMDRFINSDILWKNLFILMDRIIESLENLEINQVFDILGLDEETSYNLIKDIFNKSVRKDLPELIKAFNISVIVEETILSFDNAFTEKLILDIASKELRAITILGGFLGALIGILNPIIQRILL